MKDSWNLLAAKRHSFLTISLSFSWSSFSTIRLVEENGARIERELQLLHTEPSAFKGRDVYQRWIEDHVDHGVVHGIVRDVDDDRDTGAVLWGIDWEDGTKSDFKRLVDR